jgi:hypothetical protein
MVIGLVRNTQSIPWRDARSARANAPLTYNGFGCWSCHLVSAFFGMMRWHI